MKITRVKMAGFKQFADPIEISFQNGENIISGDNNQGKTTIAEAICYALTGRDLFGAITVDHLMTAGGRSMEVEVAFWTGEETHTIIRSREYNKKGDTVNTVILDGEKATQTKIDAIVGDYRYFLACWNPNYIHTLDDAKASDLLRSLTTPPAKDVILAALDPATAETLATLSDLHLADPAGTAKKLRAEIKADESKILKLTGQVDVYKAEIKQEIPNEAITYDDAVADLEKEIAAARSGRPGLDQLPKLKQRHGKLLTNYNAIRSQIELIPPEPDPETSICPTCKQHLDEIGFVAVTVAHAADAKRVQVRNEQRVEQINKIVAEAKDVAGQIHAIEAAEWFNDGTDELANLVETLDGLRSENDVAKAHNQRRAFILAKVEDAKKQLQQTQETIDTARKAIPGKENEIAALGAYAEKKEELTIGRLTSQLDRLSVRLFKVIKETGELKPSFDLIYDGQTYKTMSNSNRIRAGLELAAAINTITGAEYPTYIDNAEAIGDFIKPAGQYFRAIVQSGDLAINGFADDEDQPDEKPALTLLPEPEEKPKRRRESPPQFLGEPESLPTIAAPASGPDDGESLLNYHKRMTARIR